MSPFRNVTPWQDPAEEDDREEMLAPRTQFVSDRETYLGQGRHDIGRRIANDQVELFASTDPASALQMAFQQHLPRYVAVHDIGTSAALRLLGSLANATGSGLQRLTVRRQGHGEALVELKFIEVRAADDAPVRVYASEPGEGGQQSAVARVLLGNSSLGVLLIGTAAPEVVARLLQPFYDGVHQGPWPNRELLMVPLGSGVALAAHAAHLSERSKVAVHVTPRATKTQQAWSFIAGAWNRLHGHLGGEHTVPTDFGTSAFTPPVPSSEAATEPMGLYPTPPPPPPAPAPAPVLNAWQLYADNCSVLKGAVACCVFDSLTHKPLAHAGTPGTSVLLAEQGAKLMRSMTDATRALGFGTTPTDGAVTAGAHLLLVRPVPGHPGTVVHLVLSGSTNLTLAKLQLERIVPPH
jgi:hypothetical protein